MCAFMNRKRVLLIGSLLLLAGWLLYWLEHRLPFPFGGNRLADFHTATLNACLNHRNFPPDRSECILILARFSVTQPDLGPKVDRTQRSGFGRLQSLNAATAIYGMSIRDMMSAQRSF